MLMCKIRPYILLWILVNHVDWVSSFMEMFKYNATAMGPQTNHSKVNLLVEQYPNMLAFMFQDSKFTVNYTILCPSTATTYKLHLITDDRYVAFVKENETVLLHCVGQSDRPESSIEVFPNIRSPEFTVSGSFDVLLGTDLLGRTWLDFILLGESQDGGYNFTGPSVLEKKDIEVDQEDRILRVLLVVLKKMRDLDNIFRIVVYILIISTTIGMGCKTDLDVVKTVLKKPVAPAIGFACQYICMPLIAFGISKSIKFDNPAVALGIFACGICPGGGISNIYCYVLNGDVSLSVTMTTLSTIAALGLIPFWMFTLGQLFGDEKTTVNIPYLNIMTTLALVIVPLFVGILIKYKCLKVSKIILKVIKPVSLVTIVILLTFGIYVNMYIFRLFKPLHILAGCLLPYFGYIIGGVIALIFRQPWDRVKTIAIETGIQNVGVAFLMLLTSLPPPDGDLAAVGPAASGIMTPLPLFVISIAYVIYNRCKGVKYQDVPTTEKDPQLKEVNGNSVTTTKEIIINESLSSV